MEFSSKNDGDPRGLSTSPCSFVPVCANTSNAVAEEHRLDSTPERHLLNVNRGYSRKKTNVLLTEFSLDYQKNALLQPT